MIWFTSDLHLGHRSIIQMNNRPFADVDEMNRALIRNINSCVHQGDRLYILGDFAHHISGEERNELAAKIHGKKYLILGNHDIHGNNLENDMNPALFEEICVYKKESFENIRLVMMHYPLLSWEKMRAGSVMLHGHIHSTPQYNEDNIKAGIRRFDVGMDANDFHPVSLETIRVWADQAGLCEESTAQYMFGEYQHYEATEEGGVE